jgi:cytochrome c peroxidase
MRLSMVLFFGTVLIGQGTLANAQGLPVALDQQTVPLPPDLSEYVANTRLARILGKALFWDMQVSSDNQVACATCHFHAGADSRVRNQLGLPQNSTGVTLRRVNYPLYPGAFPFRQLADPTDRNSRVIIDTGEVVSSQGMSWWDFAGVIPGTGFERRTGVNGKLESDDPVFNYQGLVTRRAQTRNAPTVINSVFMHRLFHDGRARSTFNGVDRHGIDNPNAMVWQWNSSSNQLTQVSVAIKHAALASQAVTPPTSENEMSWIGKSFPDLGQKMLTLIPLLRQEIHPDDSLLGRYANHNGRGFIPSVNYATLVRRAFHRKWWGGSGLVDGQYTQMEANYSLFFGLAVMLYESTLVSDQSPYDEFASGNTGALTAQEKQGLQLFVSTGCITCHSGSVFGGGAVADILGNDLSSAIAGYVVESPMADGGTAWIDNGFVNIGLRPTSEDPGAGANDGFGPISFAQRMRNGGSFGGQTLSPDDRIAVDGAIRVPTLRNVELTGPYFHTGSMKSLEEVVQFYARGTDFDNMLNRPAGLDELTDLNGDADNSEALIAFLKTLTDDRVRHRKAPFDHPQLLIIDGHRGYDWANRYALDWNHWMPAVGADGAKALKPYDEVLTYGRLQLAQEAE